jgi:hypothetical protein
MKEITVNGRVFQYETFSKAVSGEFGETYYWTEFYQGIEEKWVKKYWLFGEKILKRIPILRFKIHQDSNNERLPKSWWRETIEKEVELLDRREQLEKGELI